MDATRQQTRRERNRLSKQASRARNRTASTQEPPNTIIAQKDRQICQLETTVERLTTLFTELAGTASTVFAECRCATGSNGAGRHRGRRSEKERMAQIVGKFREVVQEASIDAGGAPCSAQNANTRRTSRSGSGSDDTSGITMSSSKRGDSQSSRTSASSASTKGALHSQNTPNRAQQEDSVSMNAVPLRKPVHQGGTRPFSPKMTYLTPFPLNTSPANICPFPSSTLNLSYSSQLENLITSDPYSTSFHAKLFWSTISFYRQNTFPPNDIELSSHLRNLELHPVRQQILATRRQYENATETRARVRKRLAFAAKHPDAFVAKTQEEFERVKIDERMLALKLEDDRARDSMDLLAERVINDTVGTGQVRMEEFIELWNVESYLREMWQLPLPVSAQSQGECAGSSGRCINGSPAGDGVAQAPDLDGMGMSVPIVWGARSSQKKIRTSNAPEDFPVNTIDPADLIQSSHHQIRPQQQQQQSVQQHPPKPMQILAQNHANYLGQYPPELPPQQPTSSPLPNDQHCAPLTNPFQQAPPTMPTSAPSTHQTTSCAPSIHFPQRPEQLHRQWQSPQSQSLNFDVQGLISSIAAHAPVCFGNGPRYLRSVVDDCVRVMLCELR